MQVIPAWRPDHLQASLAVVESIHKRIKRLRASKGLSQEALAKAVGVRYQSVQEWERDDGTAPSRKRLEKVAKALGVSLPELVSGGQSVQEPQAAYGAEAVARDAREEIVLHLYRGLFSLQQARLIQGLRALFDANQITRKELGQKPLRGVSDDQVERAFGAVPVRPKKAAKGRPGRQLGDAMGDFLDDIS